MSRRPGARRRLVDSAKRRADKFGLAFELSVAALEWPTHCPVLGIELDYVFSERVSDNHPSLDQTVPRGGYTLANTRVISKRANNVKGNATAAELFAVARYMTAVQGLQLVIADGTVPTPNSVHPIGDPNMSDLKQIALEHAVKVSSDGDMALATAKKFHAFLTGTPATTAATDKPVATAAGKTGTAAGKAKVATPEEKAAAKLAAKQAAEAAAQDAEGEGDGPTKEQAGAKIKELIAANLREEGKALLEEFGATALSSLKAEDYGMFIEKADELLMGA